MTAAATAAGPPGLLYRPALITPAEERTLIRLLEAAPAWHEVKFRGQTARRRALSFGGRYLTQGRRLLPAPALPPDLAGVRDRMVAAACQGLGPELALAGRAPEQFALCTALSYPPG